MGRCRAKKRRTSFVALISWVVYRGLSAGFAPGHVWLPCSIVYSVIAVPSTQRTDN
jgi:hypothetical protein